MSRVEGKHSKPEVKKKRGPVGIILRFFGILLLVIVLLAAGLVGFLSLTEYRPTETEPVDVNGDAEKQIAVGDSLKVMSWNIGYGALGDNADFFMDGGSSVITADEQRVQTNMDNMISEIKAQDADVIFLQEVDRDSKRSHHVNEVEMIGNSLQGYDSDFANNFKVAFIPYPIPPMGKVDSGLVTFSKYTITSADRIQLPIPFSWPVRMANLKRCLLVSRVELEGTDKDLVLVDLHLEAYDDGAGKKAQAEMLEQFLQGEAEKGNYVIAGGDFNQIFSSVDDGTYPTKEGPWMPGRIDVQAIDGDWQFIMDKKVPSCRSLHMPLEGADKNDFLYYLIDGFIVSGNITVDTASNLDLGFKSTDHNPVVMELTIGSKTDAGTEKTDAGDEKKEGQE